MTVKKSLEIAKRTDCCACYACVNICTQKSISMEKDSTGVLYPRIDAISCVGCNRCRNVCPALNSVQVYSFRSVFAAYSKVDRVRSQSSSGGVATELSKQVIAHGGVVYGVSNIDIEAKFIRVDKENDLKKIQGSKYVHSHIGDCFKLIQNDLRKKKEVLLIGLPCQIAGARKFFDGKCDGLYLMEILCHGTPSQDSLEQGIMLETNQKVTRVTFRDGNRYCLTGYNQNSEVFKTPYRMSYWLNGFVEGYIFRENCYSCKYAGIERCGDITVGDFWGLGKKRPYGGEVGKGVNLVMINTEKGEQMWNLFNKYLNYERRDIQEAIPYNHSLQKPAPKPNRYHHFEDIYMRKGAAKALREAYPKKTLFVKIRRRVRKSRKVYEILVRIPYIGNKLKEYPD